MTRAKLIAAIRIGQKRGGTPDQIADAIELMIEMDRDQGDAIPATSALEPDTKPMPKRESVVRPPDFTNCVVPLDHNDQVLDIVPLRDPAPITGKPQVVLATESDVRELIKPKGKPFKLRSMSGGPSSSSRAAMKTQEAMSILELRCPQTLHVIPDGRDKAIPLEREISFLPGMIPGPGKKPIDMVKVSYRHPQVGPEFEVQECIVVSDMTRDFDPSEALAKIELRAKQMYKPRPTSITPRSPGPPGISYSLDQNGRVPVAQRGLGEDEGTPQDQDRIVSSVNQGPAAIEALAAQIAGTRR